MLEEKSSHQRGLLGALSGSTSGGTSCHNTERRNLRMTIKRGSKGEKIRSYPNVDQLSGDR